ncbi:MAG: lipopolysaccharide biosynthesis protein [Planctomycetes bacterium]|nr:lipopolysaccharide biosynthesis protein [Planctomycetota bacterium]MCK5642852.1 lipopolysaccharide biosynthesis protein [Gammaproteobacteria bacterium]
MDKNKKIDTVEEIKSRSLRAVKWSTLAEVFSRVVPPITLFVLARLLSPSDFGVVGIAIIVVGLAQMFQEFGFGKALIQTKENVEIYANNAFWMNAWLGCVIYVVLFFTAPFIAFFFNSPESIIILRVFCLQVVITGFFAVHSAWLLRKMDFKSIFFVRVTASILPGCVSVVMAFSGMGVWSLVWGTLTGSMAQLVLYWILSDLRPAWNINFVILKKMVIFSRWILLEGFFGWIINWGGSIAIGHYLGVKELGIFRLGVSLLLFVSYVFFTPIIPVALSFFSRLQSNGAELKNSYIKLTQIISALSLPLGVGIALLAKPIAVVFLGEKWIGIEIVILYTAIRVGLGWVFGLNSTIYTAIGRPDLNAKLLIATSVVTLPAYILGAQYGLYVFCVVRLITSLMENGANYFIAKKTLDLPATFLLRPLLIPISGVIVMTIAIVIFMNFIDVYNITGLILAVVIGVLSYVASLWIIKKDFVIWSFRYGRQVFG